MMVNVDRPMAWSSDKDGDNDRVGDDGSPTKNNHGVYVVIIIGEFLSSHSLNHFNYNNQNLIILIEHL